jgi:hypothetical protein
MYGLQRGERPYISVVATREQRGVMSALTRVVTGRRQTDEIAVRWEDSEVAGLPVESRAVDLDLRTFAPGRYTLSVVVQVNGQHPVESSRTIEIVQR